MLTTSGLIASDAFNMNKCAILLNGRSHIEGNAKFSLLKLTAKEELVSGVKKLLATGSIASNSATPLAKTPSGTTRRVGTNSCLQPSFGGTDI